MSSTPGRSKNTTAASRPPTRYRTPRRPSAAAVRPATARDVRAPGFPRLLDWPLMGAALPWKPRSPYIAWTTFSSAAAFPHRVPFTASAHQNGGTPALRTTAPNNRDNYNPVQLTIEHLMYPSRVGPPSAAAARPATCSIYGSSPSRFPCPPSPRLGVNFPRRFDTTQRPGYSPRLLAAIARRPRACPTLGWVPNPWSQCTSTLVIAYGRPSLGLRRDRLPDRSLRGDPHAFLLIRTSPVVTSGARPSPSTPVAARSAAQSLWNPSPAHSRTYSSPPPATPSPSHKRRPQLRTTSSVRTTVDSASARLISPAGGSPPPGRGSAPPECGRAALHEGRPDHLVVLMPRTGSISHGSREHIQ